MKLFRSGFGASVLSLAAIAAGYFGGRPLLERVQFDRAEADVQATREQLSTDGRMKSERGLHLRSRDAHFEPDARSPPGR